jgi:hypothetical protein
MFQNPNPIHCPSDIPVPTSKAGLFYRKVAVPRKQHIYHATVRDRKGVSF